MCCERSWNCFLFHLSCQCWSQFSWLRFVLTIQSRPGYLELLRACLPLLNHFPSPNPERSETVKGPNKISEVKSLTQFSNSTLSLDYPALSLTRQSKSGVYWFYDTSPPFVSNKIIYKQIHSGVKVRLVCFVWLSRLISSGLIVWAPAGLGGASKPYLFKKYGHDDSVLISHWMKDIFQIII